MQAKLSATPATHWQYSGVSTRPCCRRHARGEPCTGTSSNVGSKRTKHVWSTRGRRKRRQVMYPDLWKPKPHHTATTRRQRGGEVRWMLSSRLNERHMYRPLQVELKLRLISEMSENENKTRNKFQKTQKYPKYRRGFNSVFSPLGVTSRSWGREARGARGCGMIHAVFVVNNYGELRLSKFYVWQVRCFLPCVREG